MSHGVGDLYLTVEPPSFVAVDTKLGVLNFTPKALVTPCEFSLAKHSITEGLNLPLTVFEAFCVISGRSIGYAFQSSVTPIKTKNGLLYKYSQKDELPVLYYRDDHFMIYHAANAFTLISRPYVPPVVENLIFSI